MNFQDKLVESTAEFRGRAAAIATTALQAARVRAAETAKRADGLKTSWATLQVAGRELSQVARRHVGRFVAQNVSIAREAGKDVTTIARSTYHRLAYGPSTAAGKSRRPAASRKRTSRVRARSAARTA